MTWSAVAGATGYRIYRTGGTPITFTINSGATTSYSDSSVTQNSFYSYSVSARFGASESSATQSSPTSILSPHTCPGPFNVSRVAGCASPTGSAQVTWETPVGVDALNNPVVSYQVKVHRDNASGTVVHTSAVLGVNKEKYVTPSVLSPSVTYYFEVLANYQNSDSGSSTSSGATVLSCGVNDPNCSFVPPNAGDAYGNYPVVGKPVTFSLNINSGTAPFSILWTDSDGLNITTNASALGQVSITRVYSTIGHKDVVVQLTDSTNAVSICSMSGDLGPNVRVRPAFNER